MCTPGNFANNEKSSPENKLMPIFTGKSQKFLQRRFFLKTNMGRGEGGVGFLPQRKYGSPWSLILTGVFGLFLLLYDYEYNYFIFKICSWLGNKKSLLQTLGMESQGGLWSSCTFHACSLVRCSHRLSIFLEPKMLMLILMSRIPMSMFVINLTLKQF